MFFEPERIAAFREMICADTKEQREHALEKILPYQQSDFEALYEALEGTPVTIRFLDPPLHEFVPTEEADIEILATSQGKTVEQIRTIIAALLADEIAKEAEFFCFGTNDLTQMTFGFSRDDAGKFLNAYYETKIFESDPFAKLDQNGVGKLMEMAVKLGKATRPSLHVGICGEHGGDPASVEFCHRIGLDYVSCSPFRVPIARLAAAQAAIKDKKD